ncbi:alpha/beta fold hydrolase [Cupriavidus basilensis]
MPPTWLAADARTGCVTRSGYVVPKYVADMVTLIARLNVEKVDWFGTSLGGLIGMGLAGLPNSPVRKLLLNDVGPRITASAVERIGSYVGLPVRFKTFEEGLSYLADHQRFVRSPHARAVARAQWRDPQARPGRARLWNGACITIRRSRCRSAIPRRNRVVAGEATMWQLFEAIEAPVLVVRGAQSDLLLRDTVADMVARGKYVSSVEIPDAGHAPTFVDPAQIAVARQFFLGTA